MRSCWPLARLMCDIPTSRRATPGALHDICGRRIPCCSQGCTATAVRVAWRAYNQYALLPPTPPDSISIGTPSRRSEEDGAMPPRQSPTAQLLWQSRAQLRQHCATRGACRKPNTTLRIGCCFCSTTPLCENTHLPTCAPYNADCGGAFATNACVLEPVGERNAGPMYLRSEPPARPSSLTHYAVRCGQFTWNAGALPTPRG